MVGPTSTDAAVPDRSVGSSSAPDADWAAAQRGDTKLVSSATAARVRGVGIRIVIQ